MDFKLEENKNVQDVTHR